MSPREASSEPFVPGAVAWQGTEDVGTASPEDGDGADIVSPLTASSEQFVPGAGAWPGTDDIDTVSCALPAYVSALPAEFFAAGGLCGDCLWWNCSTPELERLEALESRFADIEEQYAFARARGRAQHRAHGELVEDARQLRGLLADIVARLGALERDDVVTAQRRR